MKLLFFGSVLLSTIYAAQAGRMFILDDQNQGPSPANTLHRVRRQTGPGPLGPLSGAPRPRDIRPRDLAPLDEILPKSDHYGHDSYHHHKPGKVGPVYTFVKTDPYAHVKWGVRHVVGKQYGR